MGQSSESLGAPPPSEAPPLPAPSVEPHASRPAVEDSQLLGMPPHSQVLEFDQTLEQDMEEAFAKVTEKGANTSKSMDDSIFRILDTTRSITKCLSNFNVQQGAQGVYIHIHMPHQLVMEFPRSMYSNKHGRPASTLVKEVYLFTVTHICKIQLSQNIIMPTRTWMTCLLQFLQMKQVTLLQLMYYPIKS